MSTRNYGRREFVGEARQAHKSSLRRAFMKVPDWCGLWCIEDSYLASPVRTCYVPKDLRRVTGTTLETKLSRYFEYLEAGVLLFLIPGLHNRLHERIIQDGRAIRLVKDNEK